MEHLGSVTHINGGVCKPVDIVTFGSPCQGLSHAGLQKGLSDEEYRFWLSVRNTHAEINGKATKGYTKQQMVSWYNRLHTDTSEYKMWGNGVALPPTLFVLHKIRVALTET